MKTRIRVALAQIASKMGDIEHNFSKVFEYLEKAKKAKADVVVYPELATAGYLSQGLFLETAEREETYLGRLVERAKDVYVVLGLVEETELSVLHNSAVIVGGGGVVKGEAGEVKQGAYRKCYLPTYGMFEEHRWFAPGCRVPVFNLDIAGAGRVKTGVVICEDYWQPLPIRIAALRGAQFVNILSASPKTLSKPKIVDALLRARAVENSTFIVFVNAAGSEDMVNFWGGSKIIAPDGEVLVEARQRVEDFVTGEVDLYRQRKLRQLNPMLRGERREMLEDYAKAYEEAMKI